MIRESQIYCTRMPTWVAEWLLFWVEHEYGVTQAWSHTNAENSCLQIGVKRRRILLHLSMD